MDALKAIFDDVSGEATNFNAYGDAGINDMKVMGKYTGIRGQLKTYMQVEGDMMVKSDVAQKAGNHFMMAWSLQSNEAEGDEAKWFQSTMFSVPQANAAGNTIEDGLQNKIRYWAKDSAATKAFWSEAADTTKMADVHKDMQHSLTFGWDLKEDKSKWAAPDAEGWQKLSATWTRDYSGLLGGSASGEKFNLKVGEKYPMAWASAVLTNDVKSITMNNAHDADWKNWAFQTEAMTMNVLAGAETLVAGAAVLAASMLI